MMESDDTEFDVAEFDVVADVCVLCKGGFHSRCTGVVRVGEGESSTPQQTCRCKRGACRQLGLNVQKNPGLGLRVRR